MLIPCGAGDIVVEPELVDVDAQEDGGEQRQDVVVHDLNKEEGLAG